MEPEHALSAFMLDAVNVQIFLHILGSGKFMRFEQLCAFDHTSECNEPLEC